MSGRSTMLADSARRLFESHSTKEVWKRAEGGIWPEALWNAVEEAGFTAALLPEDAAGFGATTAEALTILRIASGHTAPIPLAETMLASWLLAQARVEVPAGPLSVTPVRRGETLVLARAGDGWHLTGKATRIPWGRNAAALATLVSGPDGLMIAAIPQDGFKAESGLDLAAEPRDTVLIDAKLPAAAAARAPDWFNANSLRAAGAAIRSVQIAGAMERMLNLCIEYVTTRVQFGRPIGKFQAIQHSLAIMAGHAAAAGAAGDMAADALDNRLNPLMIGAAKARAGEAASVGAGLAHQVHGAIGFTQEYGLHFLTRRLWSWRDEFGKESEWNALVGRIALEAGGDGLWPAITEAA